MKQKSNSIETFFTDLIFETYTSKKLLEEAFKEKLNFIKLVESTNLNEINMGANALTDFLNNPAASSMLAGFEAELVFKDFYKGKSNPGADFANDVPVSFDDIIEYFTSGSNYNLVSSAEIKMHLEDRYADWVADAVYREWKADGKSFLEDYIDDNNEFDEEDAQEVAAEELADEYEDFDNLDESKQESLIAKRVKKIKRDFVNEVWNEGDYNRIYRDAYEYYKDYTMLDFDKYSWLESENITYDYLAQELNIPHPDGSTKQNAESEHVRTLAGDLSKTFNVKTVVSTSYHGAPRSENTWIFEPDSSIATETSDDLAIEIVSPPLPFKDCVSLLPKFFAWAKSHGAISNSSTGFHMSVSIKGHRKEDLDYVKLILLLGDQHVLRQFGREMNTYTSSAVNQVKLSLKSNKAQLPQVFNYMRQGILKVAADVVAKPGAFGKYVSINPKEGYIEFRSAGGQNYINDAQLIQSTLLRYARATVSAMDPAMDKQEYAKKFYKLLTWTKTSLLGNDVIELFTNYSMGIINRDELKSELERRQRKKQEFKFYEIYNVKYGFRAYPNAIKVRTEKEAKDFFEKHIAERDPEDAKNLILRPLEN